MAAFGLDESPQMVRQAGRRLRRLGQAVKLTRGMAMHLPFLEDTFESVVAIFPAEFIFEAQTLREIWRVLVPGGRLHPAGRKAR